MGRGDLAAALGLPESTISHRHTQLRNAGLVESERCGMNVLHRAHAPHNGGAMRGVQTPTAAIQHRRDHVVTAVQNLFARQPLRQIQNQQLRDIHKLAPIQHAPVPAELLFRIAVILPCTTIGVRRSVWNRVEPVGSPMAPIARPRQSLAHLRIVTISRADLVETYGQAILSGNAAVFIGAGMSLAAGYPDWGGLLEPIQTRCNIPDHPDLPLVAEYITHDTARGGRPALETHILTTLVAIPPVPTASHLHLRSLAIKEIWTTNYDRLIETAIPEAVVVAGDDAIHNIASQRRAVIKMHGSIAANSTWEQPPIITRSDFERYESDHPRTWTVLRSSYMSRTMLFLGFSFSDANVEILLRLARTLGTAHGDRHIAVMKTPSGGTADDARQHQLRVADLEKSGITVCEIDRHEEVPEILADLVLRTRPEHLFVAGSSGITGATPAEEDAVLQPWCAAIAATMIDEPGWTISSLGGRAGWLTTRDVAGTRRKEGTYDPGKLLIHFRGKNEPPVVPDDRVGTSIYSDLTREQLVPSILDSCRALVAICGGSRTAEEIAWALDRNVPVIPLAASGGAARDYWEANRTAPPDTGSRPTDPGTWDLLNDDDAHVAARAVKRILDQAMYK